MTKRIKVSVALIYSGDDSSANGAEALLWAAGKALEHSRLAARFMCPESYIGGHMSKSMHRWSSIFVVSALSCAPLCGSAQALSDVRAICQFVGSGAGEPIGDREGHGLQIHDYSCVNQGGAEDGAVMTGSSVAEYDMAGSVMLAGFGMLRKPGGLAVYELSEQRSSLLMKDGKVAGFTGASKGEYKFGTGTLAAISGKMYTSTFHSISPSQFVIDIKFQ